MKIEILFRRTPRFAMKARRWNAWPSKRSLFYRESARIFGAAALFVYALRTRNDATRRHDVCHDAVHKLRPTICIVTHLPRDTFPLFEAAFPTQCQWKKRGQNRPFYFCSPPFSFLPFSFTLFIPSLCRFPSFCLFHLLPLFPSWDVMRFFFPHHRFQDRSGKFLREQLFRGRSYRGRAATPDCKLPEIFRAFSGSRYN